MEGNLRRTSSHTSTFSVRSQKSGTIRVRSRKHSSAFSSAAPTPTTATTDKSLTSFPSLSPENSPDYTRERSFLANPRPQSPFQTRRKSSKHKPSIVESLTTTSPSFRGRSALFEDTPPNSGIQNVPGTLHHASDDHIRRLVSRTGVVALVRQLAEDLAHRDAEMTKFRQRAEERERELKRMLREVEVSNLDIETRLHHLSYNTEVEAAPSGKEKETTDRKGGQLKERDKASSRTNGIDEMIGEAMKEDVGTQDDLDDAYLESITSQDKEGTVKATNKRPRDSDGKSTHSSLDSQGKVQNTGRGWRDFLWNGTSRKTSRASSVLTEDDDEADVALRARASSSTIARRKELNADLFRPPRSLKAQKENNTEGELNDGDIRSRTSSMSVASWTIKLFAGNPQVGRENGGQNTIRGRSLTTGNGASKTSRNPSIASAQTSSSARAALLRVSSRSDLSRTAKKSVQPLVLSANGILKGASQPVNALPPGSPASVDTGGNIGPVEMDTILPHDSRPPTLAQAQQFTSSGDLLTDRFGFIYDQRRRKKEAEALSQTRKGKGLVGPEWLNHARDTTEILKDINDSRADAQGERRDSRPDTPVSIDDKPGEKPTKRWQDYLKVATHPTELLSHTPSSGAVMTLGSKPEQMILKRSPTFGDNGETLPSTTSNPQPSASPITAGNAEMAKPSISSSTSAQVITETNTEPVKLLLAQLTELHDSLQREKTVKWNEFLRKVRAERRREGELASIVDTRSHQATMPEVSITDGEMIGIATLGNKGKSGRAKYKEFRSLVLTGIPVAYRAKIWSECSGASSLRIPGYYDDLIHGGDDDPAILAQIQMDINRTLTDNVFFRKGPGVVKLNEVLLAYSRRNPEVGYCQGMNLITASLLLIMPAAEDAFWVLVSMIENILPRHYYDNSLLSSRADQQVLRQYVSELLPRLSAHLDNLGIELEALTFQWFLSLFTDCLSAEALYRVWDVLLCCKDEDGNGGSTFLFQVALALLKLNEGPLVACETPGNVYAYLGGEITNHAISIDGLIAASEGLKGLVRRNEVEDRRAKWVDAERQKGRLREAIRTGNSRTFSGSNVMADQIDTATKISSIYEGSEEELEVQPPMPIEE